MHRWSGKLLTAALILLSLRLTSCSSTEDNCNTLCDDTDRCPGAVVGNYGTDSCSGACAVVQDLVESSDCEDVYDEFLECGLDAGDVCDLERGCAGELLSYFICIRDYCEANSSASECRGVLCTTGAGGTAPNCNLSRECSGEPRYELSCNDTECSCATDGQNSATIPYDDAYCSTDNDAALAAAAQACGWQL